MAESKYKVMRVHAPQLLKMTIELPTGESIASMFAMRHESKNGSLGFYAGQRVTLPPEYTRFVQRKLDDEPEEQLVELQTGLGMWVLHSRLTDDADWVKVKPKA